MTDNEVDSNESDEKLLDRIENSIKITDWENSEQWKLLDSACKRLAKKAENDLKNVPADNMLRIVELQQIAKLYGDVIGNLIRHLKDDGQIAFEEAKDRGIIQRRVAGTTR